LQSGYTVEDEGSDKPPFDQMPSVGFPVGGKILEPSVVHPEPPSVKNNKTPAEDEDGNMGPKFVLAYAVLVLINTILH